MNIIIKIEEDHVDKKLKCAWIIVATVLFVVLVIDCFFIKKLSFVDGISEMWEAFLPTVLLFLLAVWIPEQEEKKKK